MVKKLYKHELLAWLRVLTIIFGIVLGVSVMHRIIQLFENDSVYYSIVNGSVSFMYGIALLVCSVAPLVFGVVRFYKNLFTGEGYLSFTLPVRSADHLWVKLWTAVGFSILSVIVCAVSVLIVTAGDVFTEICKAGAYLLNRIPQNMVGHAVGYCLEFLVLLVVSTAGSFLLYDACICIGQLFRKNRILAAVGVYFGYNVISQILGTVLGVAMVILEASGAMDGVYAYAQTHAAEMVHIILCGSIAATGMCALVCWLICHHIIRKRLNLE